MFENCKDKKIRKREKDRKGRVRVKIRAALINLSKLSSFVSGTIEIGEGNEFYLLYLN